MSARFPFPCNHCGVCCLNVTCKVGQAHHGIPKNMPCPSLSFTGDQSHCALVEVYGPQVMGSGVGCCMDGIIVHEGIPYDFASLPDSVKIIAARQLRAHKLPTINVHAEVCDAK